MTRTRCVRRAPRRGAAALRRRPPSRPGAVGARAPCAPSVPARCGARGTQRPRHPPLPRGCRGGPCAAPRGGAASCSVPNCGSCVSQKYVRKVQWADTLERRAARAPRAARRLAWAMRQRLGSRALAAVACSPRGRRVVVACHHIHEARLHDADRLECRMCKRRELEVAAVRAERAHMAHVRVERRVIDKARVQVGVFFQLVARQAPQLRVILRIAIQLV